MLRLVRIAALAAAVLAVAAALPGASRAAFSSAAPASLPFSMAINGTDQSLGAGVPGFSVTDTRTRPTDGWSFTASMSAFSTGAPVRTMAADAFTITAVTSSCNTGCVVTPSNSVTGFPKTLTAGGAAVKIYNAAADTGVGTFNITPSIAFFLPANAYAGSYSGTLTTALVAGP